MASNDESPDGSIHIKMYKAQEYMRRSNEGFIRNAADYLHQIKGSYHPDDGKYQSKNLSTLEVAASYAKRPTGYNAQSPVY